MSTATKILAVLAAVAWVACILPAATSDEALDDAGPDATGDATDASGDVTTASDGGASDAQRDSTPADADADTSVEAGEGGHVAGDLGATCTSNTQCDGGHCVNSVCCLTACSACSSCAIPGQEGKCKNLPAGVDDPSTSCFGAVTCDGSGACVDAMGKMHFGQPCSTDSECVNGVCRAGLCKLAVADPCSDSVACGSHLCAAHFCNACKAAGDCPLMVCADGGVCALGGGTFCGAGSDCASGTCSANKYCIQAGAEACTPANCVTHACPAPSGMCASCNVPSDCPMNTACTGGNCLAPSGAFCRMDGECASGMCLPAAPLDLKKCK